MQPAKQVLCPAAAFYASPVARKSSSGDQQSNSAVTSSVLDTATSQLTEQVAGIQAAPEQ